MRKEAFRLGYIPALDGLRGAAVLLVLAFHAHVPVLLGGGVGVDVFFVLSGFLITTLLIQEFDLSLHVNFRYFYARRLLRLAPGLVLVVCVFLLSSVFTKGLAGFSRQWFEAGVALTYTTNWVRAFALGSPVFLGHTWSLSIEEQFYLLWPIVIVTALKVTSRRNVAVIAFALFALSWGWRCVLVLSGATPERTFNGLDSRSDALMLGCAIGVIVASGLISGVVQALFVRAGSWIAMGSSAGLLLLAVIGRWKAPWMHLVGFTMAAVLAALIVMCVVLTPRSNAVNSVLSARWLVWVGSLSYGLYLWHYPIFTAMVLMGCKGIVTLTIGGLITLLAASASYYGFERPILRLKGRFPAGAARPGR